MATIEEKVINFPSSIHGASFVMSFEGFLDWEHDGIAEWVDGRVYLYMSTKDEHQRVVEFLDKIIGMFVRWFQLGRLRLAPYAMRAIPGGAGREPDLFFVATENLARMTSSHLEGPADLVIEVISDDSVVRDRDEKFFEYQEAGIREYWIIDSRPNRLRADFYVLDSQRTYRAAAVNEDNIYRSTVLPHFWLNIDWLWEEDPDTFAVLAEIIGAEAMIAALRAPKE